MKTVLLLAMATLMLATETAAQWQVVFENSGTGFNGPFRWPIYLPESGNPYLEKHGNTASGLPPGNQTYSGGGVSGTNYTAQLWVGPVGSDEAQFVPVATTTFRTGSDAGYVVPVTAVVVLVPPDNSFLWQARAWENRGGAVASWEEVQADPTVPRGTTIPAVTTAGNTLEGGQSFNLHGDGRPHLSSQPQNREVLEGSQVGFRATALGAPPLSYQWQKDGASLADGGRISGARTESLTISNAQSSDAGSYSLSVANAYGLAISSNALLTVVFPPRITGEPESQRVLAGATVFFKVVAAGSEPLSYQWQFNETDIPNATGPTLILLNVEPDKAGIYSVQVSNPFGVTSSVGAILQVLPSPGGSFVEPLWSGVNNGDMFDEPDEILDEMLGSLARADLRVVRILIDFRLEMDEDGRDQPVGAYSDCILQQIDRLMVRARDKGILLLIAFQDHRFFLYNFEISEGSYSWRQCTTPENVYRQVREDGVSRYVSDPYKQRGWDTPEDYFFTNSLAKEAYKRRVEHILNHVNPYLGQPWREINDVIFAWELFSEPEYLFGATDENLRAWFNEMAGHVKGLDPDTHVALGTKYLAEGLGNIRDADIYTIHAYGGDLEDTIRRFNESLGGPMGKLLLVEEFNPGADVGHTPGHGEREEHFESIQSVCRRNGVPWMFWEHGYHYDADDIWSWNGSGKPDGIFWGAKVIPDAKKIWRTPWVTATRWGVHEKVENLCPLPDGAAGCRWDGALYFIDTFGDGSLSPGYRWFDEGAPDAHELVGRHLRIEAGLYQDLWAGDLAKRGAPILLRPAPQGDYWIETFVRADDPSAMRPGEPMPYPAQALNSQMGLFVFQSLENWLFFGLTYHDFASGGGRIQGDGLMVTKTEGGVSSVVAEQMILADFMFLRVEKAGPDWRFLWKTEDGHGWSLLANTTLGLACHEVGMGVKTFDLLPPDPVSEAQAYFDFFLIGRDPQSPGDPPEAPRLRMDRLGLSWTMMTWPAAYAGYMLEWAATLPAPSWTPLTNPPTIQGDQFAVVLRPESQQRFFRLRRPCPNQ